MQSLTHFIRDTLLGVPLGKQFGAQSRPHNVGPALSAKLFATRTVFLKKQQNICKVLNNFCSRQFFFKMAEILPSIQ